MGLCLRRSKFAHAPLAAVLVLAIVGSLSACLQSNAETCNDGTLCPGTSVCAPLGGCAQPGQAAACTGLADDAACSYSGIVGVCHHELCAVPRCGDGFKDPGEACDDGNNIDGDGCSANCLSNETCGNGIIDTVTGEQCDDGNLLDHDGCQHTCKIERCGDGIVDTLAGEVCDDGNNVDGDGCSADCRSDESCGNGIVDWAVGENCDDGNDLAGDGCSQLCRVTALATWTLRRLPTTPSKRHDQAVATDEGRARVVMFGGADANGHIAETWEWDGHDWNQVKPETSPTPRAGLAMTYDGAIARVVMFGGINGTIGNYDDTWIWDGQSWQLTLAVGSPPPRHEHAMAYDSLRKKVVMFGGLDGGDLGDTWELSWNDDQTATWKLITPTVSPSPRHGHCMAFDPRIGKVILVGGTTDVAKTDGTAGTTPTVLADTWSWDGTVWTQLGALPVATTDGALAFDTAQQQMVLFGGDDAVGNVLDTALLFNDSAWSVEPPQVPTPTARDSSTLTMSPDGESLMLFGGDNQGVASNDTWLRDGSGWALAIAGHSTSTDTNPVPQLAYDQTRGRTVRLISDFATQNEQWSTWEWDGIDWNRVGAMNSRATIGALVYDPSKRDVMFLGSSTTNTAAAMETWGWDGTTWTQLTPHDAPTGRNAPAVAADPLVGGVLLFGGSILQNNSGPSTANDTWLWDGTDWNQLSPDTSPPAQSGAALAFDPISSAMLLFSSPQSSGFNGTTPAQTWSWNGTTWTQLTPPSGTPALTQATMQTDTVDGYIILIGNDVTSASTYQWTGSDWEFISAAPFETNKVDGLAFDAAHTEFVRAGHFDVVGNDVTDDNETWTMSMTGLVQESCSQGFDVDGDGKIGCADSDCWPVCNPTCEPGTPCSDTAPSCGDGTCSSIENYRSCPADCPAPTPVCGDLFCDPGETHLTCPGDC